MADASDPSPTPGSRRSIPAGSADVTGLARLAERHHGLFRVEDAFDHDMTRDQPRRLVATDWCVREARGVYRVAGSSATWQRDALAALWACGDSSVLSHRAGARAWELPGWNGAVPEVTRLRGENQRLAVGIVHGSLVLPSAHVTVVHGLPVTTPARTCFDLAGVVRPERAEHALDAALRMRLCRIQQVHQTFFALARRGRRGTATMRALLEARGVGYVPPASELERRARRLFAEAGLPSPEFEVDLGDEAWIGRVDCLWREARVIVELDGRRYHDGLSARTADRERDNRLMASGWRVIRVTWEDIVDRPHEVIRWIRGALAARAA